MAVGRDDAPAQHMRAGHQLARIVDLDGLVVEPEGGKCLRCPVGPHQGQRQRRHRLAEGQRETLRAVREHRSVSRIGLDKRGMGKGSIGQRKDEQQKDRDQSAGEPAGGSAKDGKRLHCAHLAHILAWAGPIAKPWGILSESCVRSGTPARGAPLRGHYFLGSRLIAGAGNSNASSSCPAAGISIQRSATPSHSCTTGK